MELGQQGTVQHHPVTRPSSSWFTGPGRRRVYVRAIWIMLRVLIVLRLLGVRGAVAMTTAAVLRVCAWRAVGTGGHAARGACFVD